MNLAEERIALFIDYENLAISAREDLGGIEFDFGPVADALAERGRVITRRAYGDWTMFDEDRKRLTRHHVELIEIPQRMGAVRKNAADIKMAVDALEMAFERGYVTTFVVVTGDSDFTPLVHKLRELNKKVIGVGIRASTSALLPPACDEFLFYENLEGVEVPAARQPKERDAAETRPASPSGSVADLAKLVTTTLSGLKRSSDGVVLGSQLKRTLLRKDPTFTEADYGFRAFGELLAHLEGAGVVELSEGPAHGDPEVDFPSEGQGEDAAFSLLTTVVGDLSKKNGPPVLAGLKNQMRKIQADFSEKQWGYRGFLQFAKAAAAKGLIDLDWDDKAGDYRVRLTG